MRISDWSSDVCSSDLAEQLPGALFGSCTSQKEDVAGMGYRVAILHPAQAALRQSTPIESTRLGRVVEALRGVGIQVAGAPYADASVEEVRAQLLSTDGVLVRSEERQVGTECGRTGRSRWVP